MLVSIKEFDDIWDKFKHPSDHKPVLKRGDEGVVISPTYKDDGICIVKFETTTLYCDSNMIVPIQPGTVTNGD